MDSNFRTRLGPPPYNGQIPMYRSAASPSPAPNQMPGPPGHAAVPPVGRSSPLHHTAPHSPSLGLGIKVAVKPEYKITSPPHLSLHDGDLPWSNFQFDFTLERKFLAEAKKESPNWSSFVVENLLTKGAESSSPVDLSSGMTIGRAKECDGLYFLDDADVREFVNGYTILHEMGFSSCAVADALVMHENNTDKNVEISLVVHRDNPERYLL